MAILMAARRHTFKLRETVSHTLLSLFTLVTTVSTDRGPSFPYVPLPIYYDCKRTSARSVPNKCVRSLRPPGPLSCCPRWSSSLTAAVGIWSQAVMGSAGWAAGLRANSWRRVCGVYVISVHRAASRARRHHRDAPRLRATALPPASSSLIAQAPSSLLPWPRRDSDAYDRQLPVFSSHAVLISWSSNSAPTTLSPPFTLRFLYVGTLVFSHRTYDLSTVFALLLRQLPAAAHTARWGPGMRRRDGARAHALLPFPAYEDFTRGA
ncbi:hypothetical protein C8J57DRAFT_1520308 [Mycena rebaudengoi]|nr:hypothetical protein C8J57DRAFT_1520308 [Mycena rebaudengoi]